MDPQPATKIEPEADNTTACGIGTDQFFVIPPREGVDYTKAQVEWIKSFIAKHPLPIKIQKERKNKIK